MSEAHLYTPMIDPEQWFLDSELCFLNHGSFGACPKVIMEAQRAVQVKLESSPVHFALQQLPKLTHVARERLADFIGAPAEQLVFVSNASEGVATVLDAVKWRRGDEVILSQDSYPACRHMLSELTERHGINLKIALTPFACKDQTWEQAVYAAFKDQCSARTRLILIDHITSPTALIYPVRKLVELASEVGAISLIDGAHAPGQLELKLEDLGADFYVGNLHKWVFTPKSCAFLYAAPQWCSTLLPRVISHGYLADKASRYHSLFDWVGTRDYSAMCVLPETLDWVEEHGGFQELRTRNHKLVVAARDILCARLWPEGDIDLPPARVLGHMVALPLTPLLARNDPERELGQSVGSASSSPLHATQRWLNKRGFEVPIINTPHGVMLRVSAQAYNSLQEYDDLSEILIQLIKERTL